MLLTTRRAGADDVSLIADLYLRAYRGGYSAAFDRYGTLAPADFWWVQSEKEVFLLEVNREPRGLMIIGRRDGAMVVEDAVGDFLQATADGVLSRVDRVLIERLSAFLVQRFQEARQDRFLLRTPEANPLGLHLARAIGMAFTNTLVAAALSPRARQATRAPAGYAVRKAGPGDVSDIIKIHRESFRTAPAVRDVERTLGRPEVRAAVAERDGYPVGFLIGEARAGGFGDLLVGVREAHRRKGVGRALTTPALNLFHARGIPALGLYWGSDAVAHGFYQGLGIATERVYLFFEKRI